MEIGRSQARCLLYFDALVTAKNIRMGGGFKVEKGATLKINYK